VTAREHQIADYFAALAGYPRRRSVQEETRAGDSRTDDLGNLRWKRLSTIVHVPKWAAPPSPRASRTWRVVALSVSYVTVYLVLDRISFIEPLHGINITPWNPSTGIMLALLIVKGVRWSPVVLVAELISGATLPQIPIPPAPCSWRRSW
jgi:hypothetical protein